MVLWFAPDLLAVWSHLSGVGRATFICCLLVTVGASLAARWGDSLRVFLLLLLHLLYNFPDLALCGLQWREGRGGHREETIPVLRPHRKQRVWGLGKEKLDARANFTSPRSGSQGQNFSPPHPKPAGYKARVGVSRRGGSGSLEFTVRGLAGKQQQRSAMGGRGRCRRLCHPQLSSATTP